MAMVDRELGRTEDFRLITSEAITLLDAASRALPQTVLAYTAHGECLAVDGDIAGAIATLDAGLALRRTNPGLSPWQTIHHLLATARVQTRMGNPTAADQYLDEAERLMARFHDGMDAMHQRLRAARAENRPHRSPGPEVEALTRRERDILRLLETPLSLSEIASELYVSRNTVKTHAQAIYRKLGASTRSERSARASTPAVRTLSFADQAATRAQRSGSDPVPEVLAPVGRLCSLCTGSRES